MCFPEYCLRGISNNQFVTDEGVPSSALFYPINTPNVSINWEVNDSILDFTLEQIKDGEYQFKYGVARLPYLGIEEVMSVPILPSGISCNWDPIDDNPYHGNIVYRNDLSKEARKMISGMLALKVSHIIKRDQY